MKALAWLAPWLALSHAAQTNPRHFFDSAGLVTCPVSCEESGYDVGNWTRLQNPNLALACASKPKLLDFLIRQPLEDIDTPSVVRSCSTFRGSKVFSELVEVISRVTANDTGMSATPVDLELLYSLSGNERVVGQKITAVKEIQAAMLHDGKVDATVSGSRSIVLHYGDTVAGVFLGSAFSSEALAAFPVQQLLDHAWDGGMTKADALAVQLCSANRTADYTFGVIVDSTPGKALYRVQQAIRAWSDAECVGGGGDIAFTSAKAFGKSTVWYANPGEAAELVNGTIPDRSRRDATASNSGILPEREVAPLLSARADCRTRQVIGGDTCGSLATKCGISGTDITKFNSAQNFCSTLKVGQHICCSSGTLPDVRPKPLADGTCANYLVISGDWCDKIASANGLTVSDLESFNQKTWGWSGCGLLYVGIRMCLSKGTPPLPAPIANAICGPQMPGTPKPATGTDLATLNACPLNACCNIWGQCGTTAEFCTKSSLGPPGTSEPGKSGCISNCGTGVTNIVRPKSFMKVGYFEGWNMERPCLHMDVSQIPSSYTHIHFAFGDILPDFSVSVARVKSQFEKFVKMRGAKRVIAFGGWTASTDSTTFHIYRDGVKPENRDKLSTNLAKFVIDNDLDGLDIDWEYPGAPDIPGIPKGDPIDGPNYVELLKLLRRKLPSGKTLSIAAPASFWYLKQFPIKDIVPVVDYIIYMTYDLHGQWDYGNQWAAPGCPTGNCLRSHVNLTETYNALSMVTKAGASTDKIIVGVTSYGRSFRMTDPKCTGDMCRFTGPASGAKPGRCTGTPGYLANAEIKEILKNDPSASTTYDIMVAADVLTYGSDWVGYMSEKTKATRETFWRDFGFGGTTDWAIDLESYLPSTTTPGTNPPATSPGIRFEDINCDHALANNLSVSSLERWKTLKAGDAWNHLTTAYESVPDKKTLRFAKFAGETIAGVDNFNCDKIQENACTQWGTETCTRKYRTAGGFLIMRSFAAVAESLNAFYNGIEAANVHMLNHLRSFVDVFAPPKEDDKTLEFLFSFITMGIGLAAGPVFSKLFAANAFFRDNENTAETLEGTVMGLVEFGIGQAQASIADKTSDLNKPLEAEISTQLGRVTRGWKTVMDLMITEIFSGLSNTRGTLFKLINEGKMLRMDLPSKLDIEIRISKVLFAGLIPFAWSLRQHSPVLINTGRDCSVVGVGDYSFINPESTENSMVCVDGKQYFLLSVPWSVTARDCPHSNRPEMVVCKQRTMETLPGIETLGTAWEGDESIPNGGKWGGVTREDIAKSIVARHRKNGNRNLDNLPDASNDGVKASMWEVLEKDDFDIMPGLVNIPMCEPEEARMNWVRRGYESGHLWSGFPCNRP